MCVLFLCKANVPSCDGVGGSAFLCLSSLCTLTVPLCVCLWCTVRGGYTMSKAVTDWEKEIIWRKDPERNVRRWRERRGLRAAVRVNVCGAERELDLHQWISPPLRLLYFAPPLRIDSARAGAPSLFLFCPAVFPFLPFPLRHFFPLSPRPLFVNWTETSSSFLALCLSVSPALPPFPPPPHLPESPASLRPEDRVPLSPLANLSIDAHWFWYHNEINYFSLSESVHDSTPPRCLSPSLSFSSLPLF